MCDPENNVKYLEQYAHKNCGTLTALYNVTLEQNGFGTASMPISNDHLKMWGISVEQLHQDALLADRNRGYSYMVWKIWYILWRLNMNRKIYF